MQIQTWFGLEIPALVPDKLRFQLASLLFMSSTSIPEVKELLYLGLDGKVAKKLITNLKTEIEILLKDPNRIDIIRARLREWTLDFGPVNEVELKLIEGQLLLPKRSLTGNISCELTMPSNAFEVSNFLNRSILCQEEAVQTMSLHAFSHIQNARKGEGDIFTKAPCLIGDSGSGKSLLMRKIKEVFEANQLDVTHVSCSNLVRPGIVGMSLQDVFTNLYVSSKNHVDTIQTAIIMLDEFDKLSLNSSESDIDSKKIQNQLLQFYESGGTFTFPATAQQWSDNVTINTGRLLFILSGAFTGIHEIILKRLQTGFGDKTKYMRLDKIINHIKKEDLISFGIIPELAARMNPIPFKSLTQKDYKEIILNSEESPLKKHQQKLKDDFDITLEIEDEAVDLLVEQSQSIRELEPRLTSLLEPVYLNQVPGKNFIISADLLRSTAPVYFLYEQLFDDFASCLETPNFQMIAMSYKSTVDEIVDLYNLYKSQKK